MHFICQNEFLSVTGIVNLMKIRFQASEFRIYYLVFLYFLCLLCVLRSLNLPVCLSSLSTHHFSFFFAWSCSPPAFSPDSGIELGSPALQADSLPAELPRKHH